MQESVLQPMIDAESGATPTPAPVQKKLPFQYATANGVMVDYREGEAVLCYKAGLRLPVLAEVRRFLGVPFLTEQLDDAARRADQLQHATGVGEGERWGSRAHLDHPGRRR